MIGNDVVDLGDPEVRPETRHPRFDRRVFTADERRRIAAEGTGAPLRWILWAAKEAAFKVAARRDPTCVFAPLRFATELDQSGVGRVRHQGVDHPVQVTRSDACIHAVATEPGMCLRSVFASVKTERPRAAESAATSTSRAVRAFALADLAARLGVEAAGLAIETRRRVPQLIQRGVGESALSLSHHGRYLAYACLLPASQAAP